MAKQTQRDDLIIDLPAGTVTLLMTDIEASTRLWEENSRAMSAALPRHDSLIAESVKRHSGHLLKTRGESDAAFAVFRDATDAMACAVELQGLFVSEAWPEGAPIRVRISLHTGEVELREGDYYGPVVNRCARLRAIGYGRQVLLTEATSNLVRASMSDEVELKDLGVHRLKDLDEPEHVYQALHPALPYEFPPLRSLTVISNNLPAEVSTFVGREQEAIQIVEAVKDSRLLTLAGAGGLGKTRLAVHVARQLIDEFDNGVWLVELAPVVESSLVAGQVAQAVGVHEEPGRTLLESLVDHARSRKLLFILDNCEHMIEAASAIVKELVSQCPGVRVLATSQEPLGVEGEKVWRLRPLALPDPHRARSVDELQQYDSVKLFVERALQAKADFALAADNARSVAEICVRLDGVPLGIELAAARVKVLTPQQINERLNDRLRLLTGGSRTAPTRQQTLRAAVDWSYDLLAERDRSLFRRLSVFAGGFALESAEEICAGDELDSLDILETVAELVDKSLVLADRGDGRVRYRMLETLRQYSEEKLAEAGEEAPPRTRHLGWFTGLAEKAEDELDSSEQIMWLDRLQEEHDNFRRALAWSEEHEDQVESGLRLAAALREYWDLRGFLTEGRNWLERLLEKSTTCGQGVRAKALEVAGRLAWSQGDYDHARTLVARSLAIYRELEDAKGMGGALHSLGKLGYTSGDYPEARKMYEESLRIYREIQDQPEVATVLHSLSSLALWQGDFAAAGILLEESLMVAREVGHLAQQAGALQLLGNLAFVAGDFTKARSLWDESLQIRRNLGDRSGASELLNNLGVVARRQGDRASARSLYEECLEIRRELGNKAGVAGALHGLGHLALWTGDYEESQARFEESLSIRRELGHTPGISASLNGLGLVATETGDYEAAQRYFQECLAIRRELGEKPGIADVLFGLGNVVAAKGDFDSARANYNEALEILTEIGDKADMADPLTGLGNLALLEHDEATALSRHEEALRIRREHHDVEGLARALTYLGKAELRRGDLQAAAAAFREALELVASLGDKLGMVQCLEALVEMAGAKGAWEQATKLMSASQALREEIGAVLPPSLERDLEAVTAAARSGLGPRFEEEWRRGKDLDRDAVLEIAAESAGA